MNAPFGIPGNGPIQRYLRREALGSLPRGWIDGLTLSNDTTDATNDVALAPGVARSTVNIVDGTPSTLTRDQVDLEVPVQIIKQLDVAFAPENYDRDGYSGGDRSGGRSTSAISNTTWHGILCGGIGRQTDFVLHDAITQSSVLAELQKIGGYTAYRRIGSIIRESATIVAFTQTGDYFERATLKVDVAASGPGTSAVTRTLSVPTGIVVTARVILAVTNSGTASGGVLLSSLASTDETPSTLIGQVYGVAATPTSISQVDVDTNTSGQIRSRLQISAADVNLNIRLRGWMDPRGKDA